MTVLRALLTTYVVAAGLLCLALFLTDGPEGVALAVVPSAALLVLNGAAVDGGDGVHMLLVAGLALAQALLVYAAVAGLRSLSPTRQDPVAR